MPKSRTTNNRLHGNSKRKSETAKRKTQDLPSAASYSALKERFDAQAEELREALGQQVATTEILRVIASSSTDLQPVLDTVAENAARLCEANDAVIWRVDGDMLQRVAVCGPMPFADMRRPITRGSPPGRAVVDRQMIHVHDTTGAELETEYSESKARWQISGSRTILAVPLLREGVSIGTIVIRRTEVRPFSEKQIALLKTFADQAVIAIENVRLFQELKESLEQQTATSQILGVIASSPTDVQPVLDTVAENAARLCGATYADIFRIYGDFLRIVASYGRLRTYTIARDRGVPISRGTVTGRAVIDRQLVHVHDLAAELETEFPQSKPYQQEIGFRTILATPLLREGVPIGAIWVHRMEVLPFTDKQIELLKTFADQAVIAIENVRLFQELTQKTADLETSNSELRETLEQHTATSEILGVIC